jgi:3-isopropylmalate/(R)-2-methylmalate dehydratase large subunit
MDSHVVCKTEDGPDVFLLTAISFMKLLVLLLFLGLKERGITVLYPERTLLLQITTPTINQHLPVEDALSANQLKALETMLLNTVFRTGIRTRKKTESFT